MVGPLVVKAKTVYGGPTMAYGGPTMVYGGPTKVYGGPTMAKVASSTY